MSGNQIGLFVGTDADLEDGLWVIKNGAETELTGIAGASGPHSTGLFDQILGNGPDFTRFNATQINGLDLFQGFGADGIESLWVTDGTAAGTQEILPNNADPNGLLGNAIPGQPGFAVLNSNQ